MSTVAWPSSKHFRAALPFAFGVSSPQAGWRGMYTGNTEGSKRGADRLVTRLSLAACTAAEARERSAFFGGIISRGDWVSFGDFRQSQPRGAFGGSPTVNGAVAAGARSITLANVLPRPNLLLFSSFETDGNADGLADGWSTATNGTTGSVTPTLGAFTGFVGTQAQRITISGLGTTSSDSVAVVATNYAPVVAGQAYTLAASMAVDNACQGSLRVDWYDSTPALLSSTFSAIVPSTSGLQRLSATFTAPANAAKAIARMSVSQRSTAVGSVIWTFDAVQLEAGSVATSYVEKPTAKADDCFSIGGNLYFVDITEPTGTAAGALTLPLQLPVQKAIANGTPVIWDSPTGTWEFDAPEMAMFDYSPGALQQPVTFAFRQRIV